MALPLLSAPVMAQPSEIATPAPATPIVALDFVPTSSRPDYDKEVLQPLYKAQEAARIAKAARLATEARLAEEARKVAAVAAQRALVSQPLQAGDLSGELFGSLGYALPYGNCVLEPGVNNPGFGNPIDWAVLTQTPTIGATFLFWSNHTGVVTGIWSNGDIEVRHQNFQGPQHRFPRSMFRGFR